MSQPFQELVYPGTLNAIISEWMGGIVDAVVARGVPCFYGSASEAYLERTNDGTGWRPPERLPAVRELGGTSVALLVHPTLTDAAVGKVCDVIAAVILRATA